MKILALNATYRPQGTTTKLTEAALDGAASIGAETDMILLNELNIKYCNNCLKCYKDLDSEIGPCSIDDDVTEVLEKIYEADGVILSSPVHNGFLTGMMTSFWERAVWRLCRPTAKMLMLKGCPEPRNSKPKAMAIIVSAGMMPHGLGKKFCNAGTPFLKDNGGIFLNAECVGEMYASAVFTKKLEGEEWSKAYLFRELKDEQLQEARDLGIKLAKRIKKGNLRPYNFMGGAGRMIDKAKEMLGAGSGELRAESGERGSTTFVGMQALDRALSRLRLVVYT